MHLMLRLCVCKFIIAIIIIIIITCGNQVHLLSTAVAVAVTAEWPKAPNDQRVTNYISPQLARWRITYLYGPPGGGWCSFVV